MRPSASGSNGYILPQQHPSPTTENNAQNTNANRPLTCEQPDNIEPPHPKNKQIPRLNTNRDYEGEREGRLTVFFSRMPDFDRIDLGKIGLGKTVSSAENYAGTVSVSDFSLAQYLRNNTGTDPVIAGK